MSDNKPVVRMDAQTPEGYEGEGFFATKLSSVIGLARSYSLWPLPFATSCCGIEYMAFLNPTYDGSRFGMERNSFSPRHADMLMVCGTISKKLAPVLQQVYTQMAEPRWVVAVGACASSGGIFDTYSVLQGIDKIIPVDVYVPGCPPRPEQIIEGVMQVQALAQSESLRRRDSAEYQKLLESYGIK
ncbi:NADH-quinone oxidoreductase subunit B [Chryseobacterium taklimakanense]|uniref:NADH-quinone oxidoreductase subunit B n=1 Tax=Chryseobacterium taklimakanense TaxID=536441 RepID=UPI000F5F501F|nr:NADH-quinone oxidoreductase subunit B [Chryseobacterium taklimakanense]AZI22232.1 NADH-quinone oxidoreductase subunit B [Chryseobacterium taklimakanense]